MVAKTLDTSTALIAQWTFQWQRISSNVLLYRKIKNQTKENEVFENETEKIAKVKHTLKS